MKWKTLYNFTPTHGEQNDEPSLTIQEHLPTMSEMFKRIQGGIMPEGNSLYYPENENDFQLKATDLTDLDMYQNELDTITQKQAKKRTEKTEAETAEKLDPEQGQKAQ